MNGRAMELLRQVLLAAWSHADAAHDDLLHLANWAGELDAPAVTELTSAIDAIEQAWLLVTGEEPSQLRQRVHGFGSC